MLSFYHLALIMISCSQLIASGHALVTLPSELKSSTVPLRMFSPVIQLKAGAKLGSVAVCSPPPCHMFVRGKLCCSPSQYPLNKAFPLSWNCPFKKLFSSHKYVCVCLTMCSPLREVYDFNKNITRVRKTKQSPED